MKTKELKLVLSPQCTHIIVYSIELKGCVVFGTSGKRLVLFLEYFMIHWCTSSCPYIT